MNFLELSQSRRSIRNFKSENIPREDLIKILKAAQFSPSAGNSQPWHFYVITDKAVQNEIVNKSCGQKFLLSAPVFIIVCADKKRSENSYGERGKNFYFNLTGTEPASLTRLVGSVPVRLSKTPRRRCKIFYYARKVWGLELAGAVISAKKNYRKF